MTKTKSQQVNKNPTKQVRIDTELHRLLKIQAARSRTSIRALVEQGLAEVLDAKTIGKIEND